VPVDEHAVKCNAIGLERVTTAIVDLGSVPDAGVRVCAALREQRRDLRILAIVCCAQPTLAWHIQALMTCQVDEILDAKASPADIVGAMEGDTNARMRIQLRGTYDSAQPACSGLDQQDRSLLELVARGATDAELSKSFGVSARTIRGRLERLRDVLCVRNREELAAWAGAHGLYQPTVVSPGGRSMAFLANN
jgi:DNA-binding NarL/FixJ family response regulator